MATLGAGFDTRISREHRPSAHSGGNGKDRGQAEGETSYTGNCGLAGTVSTPGPAAVRSVRGGAASFEKKCEVWFPVLPRSGFPFNSHVSAESTSRQQTEGAGSLLPRPSEAARQ